MAFNIKHLLTLIKIFKILYLDGIFFISNLPIPGILAYMPFLPLARKMQISLHRNIFHIFRSILVLQVYVENMYQKWQHSKKIVYTVFHQYPDFYSTMKVRMLVEHTKDFLEPPGKLLLVTIFITNISS